MAMDCTSETVMGHAEQLGKHESAIKGLRDDVNRHEKIYDVLLDLSKTSNKTLGAIEIQNNNLATQGTVLSKVVVDVEDLQANAETKSTVARLHERMDDMEMKEGLKAEKLLARIQWLIIATIITGLLGLAWNVLIH